MPRSRDILYYKISFGLDLNDIDVLYTSASRGRVAFRITLRGVAKLLSQILPAVREAKRAVRPRYDYRSLEEIVRRNIRFVIEEVGEHSLWRYDDICREIFDDYRYYTFLATLWGVCPECQDTRYTMTIDEILGLKQQPRNEIDLENVCRSLACRY